MCIIFTTLTWPENPADAISEVLHSKIFLGGMPPDSPNKAYFSTPTFRTLYSTIYVALPVPKQLYPILATPLLAGVETTWELYTLKS